MKETEPAPKDDTAWVTIDTPYGVDEMRPFLDDVERLYRINSLMEFDEMRQTGEGAYLLKARNLSNGRNLDQVLTVTSYDAGVRIVYSNGLKTSTKFHIDARDGGKSVLVVTDEYGGVSLAEREARLDEVDKSLIAWGRDLHRYLRLWKKWSWIPGWEWYMRRVWQKMKPMARRISYLLIMITLAEFVVFVMIFTVFSLEFDKYLN